jgi:hypothetical protein
MIMGFIKHHAIVVTGVSVSEAEIARAKAIEFGNHVSEVVGPLVNDYCTFIVAPDGSKEGWLTSDDGNLARSKFIQWLLSEENRHNFEWVEVSYGFDLGEATITNDAWDSNVSFQNFSDNDDMYWTEERWSGAS